MQEALTNARAVSASPTGRIRPCVMGVKRSIRETCSGETEQEVEENI